jgi:thiamine biosynthesis protein ThiS
MSTRTDKIEITLNGAPRRFESGLSLESLLKRLDLDARTVVVEHNRTIVRPPALGDTEVQDGDTVELVHFVGGG